MKTRSPHATARNNLVVTYRTLRFAEIREFTGSKHFMLNYILVGGNLNFKWEVQGGREWGTFWNALISLGI